MKLVTYRHPSGEHRVGIRVSDSKSVEQDDEAALGIVIDFRQATDLMKASGQLSAEIPATATTDMVSFIQHQDVTLPAAQEAIRSFNEGKLPVTILQRETQLTLLSPIPRPPSMRDGYAFRQHVEAARRNRGVPMIPEFDHFPIYYYTNHLAVTGPGEVRVRDAALEKLDFELESAIVIGKEGRNLTAANADDHIFGYLIMNDWSARALQMEEMKLNLGPAKGKDFATSLGPYLVTKDELAPRRIASEQGERYDLRMKAYLNGKEVSDGNMKDMTWTFAQILERVSYGVTLHPGEVIGSGTVGTGCFLELNGSKVTDNLWIKPGDRMELWIEHLGRLVNTVTREIP